MSECKHNFVYYASGMGICSSCSALSQTPKQLINQKQELQQWWHALQARDVVFQDPYDYYKSDKQLLQQALIALWHHTEQTRPIDQTNQAILALEKRLRETT